MGKDKRENSQVNRWGPVIVWAVIIFALSSFSTLPGAGVILWDFFFKKSAHMFMFGILFFLLVRAMNWRTKIKNWWVPALITIFYAATDEYHQSFVAGRTALPSDVGYDSIGVMLTYFRINQYI